MTPLVCVRRENWVTLEALPTIAPFTMREVPTGAWSYTDHTAWHHLMQQSFDRDMDIDDILFKQPVLDITHTYFLMDDTRNIGVVSEGVFRKNRNIGTLHFLGLDPAYQNRRLGRYLLLYGYHQLRNHGLPVFEGETTIEHARALYLHFSLGSLPKYVADEWNSPGVGVTADICDADGVVLSRDTRFRDIYEDWHAAHGQPLPTFDVTDPLPLSYPALYPKATEMVVNVLTRRQLSGDGYYTHECQRWLEATFGCPRALLTPSCTAALELSALLVNIQPGDEVIMPSFTFPSTASAFALRGAVPVFVDIRPDTLNIDETLIEAAITDATVAIVPVHYGGVICNMTAINDIAHRHGLRVIEDAAQALGSDHSTQPYGDMTAFSFHDTKNIICGEGGALLLHDATLVDRADILWFCGTDRRQFLEGRVDYYTWQDIGSSYPPSELQAAVLWSQLSGDNVRNLTQQRLHIWHLYHAAFAHLDVHHRPTTGHNAHLYYLLVPPDTRAAILRILHRWGVGAAFHYVPLHSSPAGQRYGRVHGSMYWTDLLSQSLIRLPLYVGDKGMHDGLVQDVIDKCRSLL